MDEKSGRTADGDLVSMLVELIGDGVVLYDADGRYVAWSRAMERISGVPASKRVGRRFTELPSALPDSDSREVVRRALAGERIHLSCVRLRYADGITGWVDVSATPLWEHGRPSGAMVVIRDLSERRAAQHELRLREEQLRQAVKMEAVGLLAGGVAHDFNNLLCVILTSARFAADAVPRDSRAHEDIVDVITAAERAAALTRQLLVFSRRGDSKPEIVDIGAIFAGIEKLLRRTLGEDMQLQAHVAPGLWATRADPSQIEQVIANLAVNARDAMRRGGILEIDIANVEVSSDDPRMLSGLAQGRYVRLSVKDNGTGMAPHVREHAFNPFFTTKEAGRGTGLGLSTVYGIVKNAGGGIELESELGLGTTFRIYLPAVDDPVGTSLETGGDTTPAGFGGTVLLVEDDDGVRKAIARMLAAQGWEVLEASTGAEAVERGLLRLRQIDLLLTDAILPDLPGSEVAARLCEARTGLRVVFMSGYPDTELARRGLLVPNCRFLQKPLQLAALLATIGRTALPSVGCASGNGVV